MNISKLIISGLVLASAVLSGCSSTPERTPIRLYHINAVVNSVTPACSSNGEGKGNQLIGAVGGAAIGSLFGGGNARYLTGAVGAYVGSRLTKGDPNGSKLDCSSKNGYFAKVSYLSPINNRMITENVRVEKNIRAKQVFLPVCATETESYVCL
jgi:outer membrane murein-binding lipoprotein Lpp